MVIMATPFFTLEITRILALVILHFVVPRVSAEYAFQSLLEQPHLQKLQIIYPSTGITLSFFWKNQEADSRFAVSSGGKVFSNGFSVYINPLVGFVEFYTRGNNHRWKVSIKVPGTVNLISVLQNVPSLTVQSTTRLEECTFLLFFNLCHLFYGQANKHQLQFIWQEKHVFQEYSAALQNLHLL